MDQYDLWVIELLDTIVHPFEMVDEIMTCD